MKSSSTTLKDVAKHARVHFTTVSLALRGHPSIPEKTRNRIRRIAQRLHYAPNLVFSALTRSRLRQQDPASSPCLAYLVNRPPEKGFARSARHRESLTGARAQARSLGYELDLVFVGKNHHNAKSLDAYLQAKQIVGLIIAAFEPNFATLSLDWTRYAVVKIDSQHMPPNAVSVSSDHLQSVRLAFRQLYARGYRRIGLAVDRADEEGANYRYTEGYLIEQALFPAAERVPELLFPYNPNEATLSGLFDRWVRRHRVDAVLSNRNELWRLLGTAEMRKRPKVAFAGLQLFEESSRLAGVEANLQTVGVKAVSLLAAQLKSNQRGIAAFSSTTYVQGYWKEGASAPAEQQHHA